jgi:hypothetical protein
MSLALRDFVDVEFVTQRRARALRGVDRDPLTGQTQNGTTGIVLDVLCSCLDIWAHNQHGARFKAHDTCSTCDVDRSNSSNSSNNNNNNHNSNAISTSNQCVRQQFKFTTGAPPSIGELGEDFTMLDLMVVSVTDNQVTSTDTNTNANAKEPPTASASASPSVAMSADTVTTTLPSAAASSPPTLHVSPAPPTALAAAGEAKIPAEDHESPSKKKSKTSTGSAMSVHTSQSEGQVRPLTFHLAPLTPHTSHRTPHTSHLTPHTSHLTYQSGLESERGSE